MVECLVNLHLVMRRPQDLFITYGFLTHEVYAHETRNFTRVVV